MPTISARHKSVSFILRLRNVEVSKVVQYKVDAHDVRGFQFILQLGYSTTSKENKEKSHVFICRNSNNKTKHPLGLRIALKTKKMKKLSSILLICILTIFFGCTKDNPTPNSNNGDNSDNGGTTTETINEPPTCSITSPQEGDSFTENAQVIVSVVAEDTDGSISVVYLYIDNVGYQELTSFPYNFTIAGGYFSEGTHTLKAVAKDNGGARAEASVNIIISGPGGGTNGVYEIGDYYNREGIEGIVFRISNGGTHGTIVSLDESHELWSTEYVITGADDWNNGLTNTNLIVSNYDISNYPAFQWCNNKNINGITGWFLPSITELDQIIRLTETLNVGLLNNGGDLLTTIPSEEYLSSTETTQDCAYMVHITSSSPYYYTYHVAKTNRCRVRAIHSF